MPTKVQTFLWLVARDAILTWDNRQRSGWQGPNFCYLCQKARETIQHIFLDCGFIQEIWDTFKITEPIVAQHPKPTHIIKIWSNNITFRNKISSIMSRIAHIQENISQWTDIVTKDGDGGTGQCPPRKETRRRLEIPPAVIQLIQMPRQQRMQVWRSQQQQVLRGTRGSEMRRTIQEDPPLHTSSAIIKQIYVPSNPQKRRELICSRFH